MEIHASTQQVSFKIILPLKLRTVYNSQSGISINDSAPIDRCEKDGGCTP